MSENQQTSMAPALSKQEGPSSLAHYTGGNTSTAHLPTKKDESFYVRRGMAVLFLGFGSFIAWAMWAPMDKGVSASGWVITDTNRKTIQSPMPGVIDKILVREGDTVKAGQLLVSLNPITARSTSNSTREAIGGFEAQITGLQRGIVHKEQQARLLNQQLANLRELAQEGYTAGNKVLDLERQLLQIQMGISDDRANIQRAQQQIREYRERLSSMEFEVGNTEITSPVDGQVVNLQVFTQKGYVTPGMKLMEVIPRDDRLIVEAQLPVHLIDRAHPDSEVEMMFTAFNTNRTPHVPGKLLSVGADRLVEEKTGMPYYKVQAVANEEGARVLRDLKVRPGMPVELFIKTGEQSLMTYLLKPILDRTHSALRED